MGNDFTKATTMRCKRTTYRKIYVQRQKMTTQSCKAEIEQTLSAKQ